MKKIRSVFCSIVLFLFCMNTSMAQDVRYGLKGGLSFYKIATEISVPDIDMKESFSSDSKLGFTVGVFAEIPINDLFSIQPEVLFNQKGGSEDAGDNEFIEEDAEVTLSYIDVPVLARFNIPMQQGNINPYLHAGPFLGYLVDAKADGDDISDVLNAVNYGIALGAGVGFGNLSLELRYELGLANIIDEDEIELPDEFGEVSYREKTRGWVATLGISF